MGRFCNALFKVWGKDGGKACGQAYRTVAGGTAVFQTDRLQLPAFSYSPISGMPLSDSEALSPARFWQETADSHYTATAIFIFCPAI